MTYNPDRLIFCWSLSDGFLSNAKSKNLIGGFNPVEKYARRNGLIVPKEGWILKKKSNHQDHLEKVRTVHPRRLTRNLKMNPWKRRFYEKPSFLGSMFVFGGVHFSEVYHEHLVITRYVPWSPVVFNTARNLEETYITKNDIFPGSNISRTFTNLDFREIRGTSRNLSYL